MVHRYAACVDDREFATAAALFTVDAELAVPEPPAELGPVRRHRGTDAIVAALAAVTAVIRTEHAILGEVYEADEADTGAARGRITCVAHHWDRRGEELVDAVWHVRYDDVYELTDAGWRISRRAVTINAIETRPVRRLRPRDPD
jgi:3-phenylpropionate/cinnamic acid dioxygenase small subunit